MTDADLRALIAQELGWTLAEARRALAIARRAGRDCNPLDAAGAVLIAAHAPEGRRGPKAADEFTAAIYRESQARNDDRADRAAGALHRAINQGNDLDDLMTRRRAKQPDRKPHYRREIFGGQIGFTGIDWRFPQGGVT
jgi:hypothetical protein